MAKSKIIKQSECESGHHNFIISAWLYTSTTQKANAYTCQRCLLTLEGAHDINKVGELHRATGND